MKPILFSTAMVQAILEGRKTQTRRIIKSRTGLFYVGTAKYEPDVFGYYKNRTVEESDEEEGSTGRTIMCPYGEVGDVLWVREKWKKNDRPIGFPYFHYANNEDFTNPDYEKWKPSIFMPKEACRLFLKIKSIRVERIQDITEEDAIAEGVDFSYTVADGNTYIDYTAPLIGGKWQAIFDNARDSFISLWHKINDLKSWEQNPWVWVVEFKRTEKPHNF